jgi:hypothetical protein
VSNSSLSSVASSSAEGVRNNNANSINPLKAKGYGSNYAASLSDLLSDFFRPQLTSYRCERCAGNTLKKSYAFKQLPRVLILHLKRFLPSLVRGRYVYEKRTDRVRVDEQIDLGFACTARTRKPLPPLQQQHENEADEDQQQASPTATSAAATGVATSSSASGAQASAVAASVAHNSPDTFAALFAPSASVEQFACRCGGGSSCRHAEQVLTRPEDIAAHVRRVHGGGSEEAAPASGVVRTDEATLQLVRQQQESSQRPTRRTAGKRKGDGTNGVHAADGNSSDANKRARRAYPLSSSPSSSFFQPGDVGGRSGSAASGAAMAQRLSTSINSVQVEMRHLQADLAFLAQPIATPGASRRKRDQELQDKVLRLSELEGQLERQRADQRALHEHLARQAENGLSTLSMNHPPLSVPSAAAARATSTGSAGSGASSSSSSASARGGSGSGNNGGGGSGGSLAPLGPGVVPAYELQAVIHHKGPIATSGHYFADLRSRGNAVASDEQQQQQRQRTGTETPLPPEQWRRYDDSYVRLIDSAQALQYGETAGYLYFFSYSPLLNMDYVQSSSSSS